MSENEFPPRNIETDSAEKDSGLNGILLWLIRKGPMWARLPAIFATIAAVLAAPVTLLFNQFGDRGFLEHKVEKTDSASGQLDMTTGAKLSSDDAVIEKAFIDPNISPAEKEKAQALLKKIKHGIDHLNNPIDQKVPWTIFAKDSSKDYFGYKVFPSDKCLLIARIENNQGSAEWLPDPNKPEPTSPNRPSPPTAHGQLSAPRISDRDMPVIREAKFSETVSLNPNDFQFELANETQNDAPPLKGSLEKTPVQGTCLNPHPGNFRGAWGNPLNQCQQPFFRQFADGCSHVQVYDHCQNIWGPVVWQFCATYHHP